MYFSLIYSLSIFQVIALAGIVPSRLSNEPVIGSHDATSSIVAVPNHVPNHDQHQGQTLTHPIIYDWSAIIFSGVQKFKQSYPLARMKTVRLLKNDMQTRVRNFGSSEGDSDLADGFKEIQIEGHVEANENQWTEVLVDTPFQFQGRFDFEPRSRLSAWHTKTEPQPEHLLDVVEVLNRMTIEEANDLLQSSEHANEWGMMEINYKTTTWGEGVWKDQYYFTFHTRVVERVSKGCTQTSWVPILVGLDKRVGRWEEPDDFAERHYGVDNESGDEADEEVGQKEDLCK